MALDLDEDRSSTPISRPSSRLRSFGSGYSIRSVAFQLLPSGTSGA
jgi:hypothetical protein